MELRKSLETLQDVVNACGLMMPREWIEQHMEDARKAVNEINKLVRQDEIKSAKEYFRARIAYLEGEGLYAQDELTWCRLALEGLGGLEP